MATVTTRGKNAVLETNEIRIEGRDKVSGKTQYTADIRKPNMLWAAFATSPYAYAKVISIDTTAAKALPGVRAVLTAADIGKRYVGRNIMDWPVFAYDVVRLIGDRVAGVAADTREIAEEAVRLIEVEYEELTPLLDPFEALAPDAPVLHPERASYYFKSFTKKPPPPVPHPNVQGTNKVRKGVEDIDAVFASAHRVFEHRFSTPRLATGYIEPRATLVWVDEDGTVHVQSPNKSPFNLRDQIAQCAGIPKETIVVETSAIGGDFGGKGFTMDEFPCYFLAKATGRPVRYVQRYSEELTVAATRHRAYVTLKTAVDRDGRMIAHQSDVVYDGGAYAGTKPGPYLMAGTGYSTVPYNVPNVKVDTKSVYTNCIPGAHVRAPIDVQMFFAWEQHVEMIAEALKIDPIEFRMLNLVKHGDTAISDELVFHPRGIEVLDAVRRESGYGTPLPAGRGLGIALFCRHTGGGKTSLKVRLSVDGTLDVNTGVPDQGSGAHTMLQRVIAQVLRIEPARIRVKRGTTAESLPDPGSGASRVTHIVGAASKLAAEQLRAQLEERSGLTLDDDGGFIDPQTGRRESFDDVVARVCADGPLDVVGAFDGSHEDPAHPPDFTFSAFAIEVDVDVETGAVKIQKALLVTDVSQIINPVGHQGQIDGGFVFGLGSALMEELPLDESGKVTTLSLGEYKLPTMMDIPPFRTVLVEAAPGAGPWGAKMAGELSTSGVAPAIVNAVYNAVGVRLSEFPVTSERVYEALQGRLTTNTR
jgi:CO/xanthine dehydrogenase Mo-binding subunit